MKIKTDNIINNIPASIYISVPIKYLTSLPLDQTKYVVDLLPVLVYISQQKPDREKRPNSRPSPKKVGLSLK